MVNESTNAGMLQILDEVVAQIGIKQDDDIFKDRLFLIHGDQKTVDRMRGVRRIRGDDLRPYDQMQWFLPCLGLWHTKFNYLMLIHELSWSNTPTTDDSTLQANAAFWGRKNLANPKSFRALEDLIIHGFQARISALFLRQATEHDNIGRGTTDHGVTDMVARRLGTMPLSVFSELVESVHQIIRRGDQHEPPDGLASDQELYNHICYIRNVFPYLLLRDGIKYGDIGLLRIAIPYICLLYQASDHPRYKNEMLYLTRLISPKGACTAPLRTAILANSLVNKRNLRDSYFEKDLELEHHNKHLKESSTHSRTSGLPAAFHLEKASLTAPQNRLISERLTGQLGRQANTFHTRKSASEDVRQLALRLLQRSIRPHIGRSRDFQALDLASRGIRVLQTRVMNFNAILDRDSMADNGLFTIDSATLNSDVLETIERGDTGSVVSEQELRFQLLDSDTDSTFSSVGSLLDNIVSETQMAADRRLAMGLESVLR